MFFKKLLVHKIKKKNIKYLITFQVNCQNSIIGCLIKRIQVEWLLLRLLGLRLEALLGGLLRLCLSEFDLSLRL